MVALFSLRRQMESQQVRETIDRLQPLPTPPTLTPLHRINRRDNLWPGEPGKFQRLRKGKKRQSSGQLSA